MTPPELPSAGVDAYRMGEGEPGLIDRLAETARLAIEAARRRSRPTPGGPFCLGLDEGLCRPVAGTWMYPPCVVLSNTVCLVVGVTVLLAVLGLALNALMRN